MEKKALRNLNIYNFIFLMEKNNYIPHEIITFNIRDPLCIHKSAKQLIIEKNDMYKRYIKENKDPKIYDKVKCLQNELNSIMESNKQKHYFFF